MVLSLKLAKDIISIKLASEHNFILKLFHKKCAKFYKNCIMRTQYKLLARKPGGGQPSWKGKEFIFGHH